MLLRALFWISVVAVLMPREPDLGLGRPGMEGLIASTSGDAPVRSNIVRPSIDCAAYAQACAVGLGLVDSFQAVAIRGLSQVKADIEREDRLRSRHTTLAD